jgi:hypothetical protein
MKFARGNQLENFGMKYFKGLRKSDRFSARIQAFFPALLLCWITFFPSSAWGSAGVPPITVCGYCQSDASFASAAEQAAPNAAPGNGTVIVYPMYVINPNSEQIRYYDVNVWYDWGGMNPHSVPDGTDGSEVSGASLTQGGLQKLAIQQPGDASTLAAIQSGHQIAQAIAIEIASTIDSRDIPNAPDSAIDLIGPYDSAAGQARRSLEIGLRIHNDSVVAMAKAGAIEAAKRIADRFIGSGNYVNPGSASMMVFPDGTSILVKLQNVSTSFDGTVIYEFEIDQNSAAFSNFQPIPVTPGQFNGTIFEEPELFNDIIGLANILGINTGAFSVSGSCARMALIFVDDLLAQIQCVSD